MIRGMRVLVDANRKLNIPLHNAHNRMAGDQLLLFDNFSAIDVHNFSDFGPILAGLWADQGIHAAFERRSEYQLTDSVAYFYNNLDRVSSPSYVPTQQVYNLQLLKSMMVFLFKKSLLLKIRKTILNSVNLVKNKLFICFLDI